MKSKLGLVILCFYAAMSFHSSQSQELTGQLTSIKQAVSRYICFQVYWYGWNRRQGIPLPLRIKTEADKFFVWINGVEIYRGDRIDQFLIGTINNGSAVVISSEGYNADLQPRPQGYGENRFRFEGGQVITDAVTLPTDCAPQYDPPTPEKERMLRTVVDTIQWQLEEFVRLGVASYPRALTLIVANFNVDYPSTYVLVESPRELFKVDLQHPQHFDDVKSYKYLYPVGEIPIEPHHEDLLVKIHKHGIVRTPVLTR